MNIRNVTDKISITHEKFEVTDEGFFVGKMRVAKEGILLYPRPDGSTRKVLVLAEDLADAESLKTLRHKPITIDHPKDFVDVTTAHQVMIGHVGETVLVEDGFLKATYAVTSDKGVDFLRLNPSVREISAGYSYEAVEEPGVHEKYGEYDEIQKNRRYNHVSIVPQGRAGPDVRLNVDSKETNVLLTKIIELLNLPEASTEDHVLGAITGVVQKATDVKEIVREVPESVFIQYAKDREELLNVARDNKIEVTDQSNKEIKQLIVKKISKNYSEDKSEDFLDGVIYSLRQNSKNHVAKDSEDIVQYKTIINPGDATTKAETPFIFLGGIR